MLRGIGSGIRWRTAIFLLPAILLPSTTSASQLEELAVRAGFTILAPGNSSSELQERSETAFPLKSMSAENRRRASAVLENCSQYRRLPELQYAADPAMYRYLLQHPDVAVSTWRVMGISKFEMWQTGPMEYEAEAVDGSEGLADILYRDNTNCVFICEGRYHNPLLPKPIEASAVVWFRSAFNTGPDGVWLVTQSADVFVAIPSQSVSAVAKVLTPVTNAMMDRNLYEISLYASLMSRAVRDEPEWVLQLAQQLDGVMPQRHLELAAIARQPRQSSVAVPRRRKASQSALDRQALLPSGITILESPQSQNPAVESGKPALPSLSAASNAAVTAAGSSISIPAAPPVPERSTTGTVPVSSTKVVRDTEFALQPVVVPPPASLGLKPFSVPENSRMLSEP